MGLNCPSLLLLLQVLGALGADLQPLAFSRHMNLTVTKPIISPSDLMISSNIHENSSSIALQPPSIPPPSCHAKATCTSSQNGLLTCYGAELPYTSTGPSLIPSSSLDEWQGLHQLPGCWAVLQQLLCAAHLPSCAQGRLEKVPRALCRAALKPCRLLNQLNTSTLAFLNCTDDRIFSDHCSEDNRSKRARFNSSQQCVAPLLFTTATSAFFPGIEDCGLPCASPILSHDQYSSVHAAVGAGVTVSLICSLLAVITFLLDWQGGSKYPALAIFYLNLCLLVAAVGWLAQVIPGAREEIVCRTDGTARRGEPGRGESASCTVVFILVYYFSIAASVWLVILSYTWSVAFTYTPGKVQETLASRSAYFHMTAWSLPLVLTILVMATNNVDGSAVSGICYVGYSSRTARAIFVLVPHSVSLVVSGFFTWRSVTLLASLCHGAGSEHLSTVALAKLRSTLTRITLFSVMVAGCVFCTLVCHIYRWFSEASWDAALHKLVLCNLKLQLSTKKGPGCILENGPNLGMVHLELLAACAAGVLAACWVCTKESLNTWLIGVRQLVCRQPSQRPVKLRKHEIIAQAFSKRNELQAHGRLSLSFQSAHEDPLGMGWDLDPETSGDFSSGWAAALPHLVTRRPGLCGAQELGLARRSSIDSVSNISRSVSIRSGRFSWLGSRKGSVESQEIGQSDLDRLQAIYDETIKGKKRSKRDFFRTHRQKVLKPWSRLSSRRNSVTSRGSSSSSVISQVLPAITLPQKRSSKLGKTSVPQPGCSTDFGALAKRPGNDPGFKELEDRLQQLATASRNTEKEEREGVEVGVQVGVGATDVATQVSPRFGHRTVDSSTSMTDVTSSIPPLLTLAPSPLQHIEANVVSIRVLPSSEDSSIPSSYEKDFKMKKLSPRGKENSTLEVEIPALKTLPREGGLMRPREHHRGRRGAIVQRLSPGAQATDTATDS